MAEAKKLPINISADSEEKFGMLKALVKKLPENFLKQFATITETLGGIHLTGEPCDRETLFCIGYISDMKQDKEKYNWYGTPCSVYRIATILTMDGKDEILHLKVTLADTRPLHISSIGRSDYSLTPKK